MTVVERIAAGLSDRYRIERELGAGGMATVYLARDLKHERDVAVKVLRSELAAVLGVERFLQEIKLSASLDHPHILTLIDSGAEGGLLYYVLPLVRGESLRARLQREGQLPIEEALAISRQVASALDYAHKRGVIHRDIKPENILLHEGLAVVADFGIALALREAGGPRLTETGLSLGTPQYMSPEQATGDRTLDARADVYSLGAVLYEMLAGEPPHSGASVQAVIAKLLTERPTRPRVLRDTIPESVDAAVLKALAKVPADRYPTAGAFAEALSPSAGAARRFGGWSLAEKRWRIAAIAAVALAAVIAGAMWRGDGVDDGVPAADPRRLAVLPFRSIGPESLRPVAEGFTDGLIRELSLVHSLQVISWSGVWQFRNGDVGRDSIRRALNVGSLVEGVVTQLDDKVRVSVSLVDATRSSVIVSATFERPAEDLLALQDSILARVALFLRQRLGEEIQMRQARVATRSDAAWRHLQEARNTARAFDSLLAAGDTALARSALVRADTLLGSAAAADPRWSKPLSERGWLAWRSRYLVGALDPRFTDDWTLRAISQATAALAVAPGDPDALALRGTARYFRHVTNLGKDPRAVYLAGDSAEADFRAAVEKDPGQDYAWSLLSHRLMRSGSLAEAKLAAIRSYEADEYMTDAATILWRLFSASLDLGDRLESERWCSEGTRRFPSDPVFWECQITAQALPGQRPNVPEMWRALDHNVSLYPPNQREYRRRRGQLLVAMTLVRAGYPDSARSVALHSRAGPSIDPSADLTFIEMMLRNLLGDRDEAVRLAATYYAANPQARTVCGGVRDSTATEDAGPGWWTRGLDADPRYRAVACVGR